MIKVKCPQCETILDVRLKNGRAIAVYISKHKISYGWTRKRIYGGKEL